LSQRDDDSQPGSDLQAAVAEQRRAFEECRSAYLALRQNLREGPLEAQQGRFKLLLKTVEAMQQALQRTSATRDATAVSSWNVPFPGDSHASAESHTSAKRVLVVDDNVDDAGMLGLLLRTLGHDVDMAHDGATAINAANRKRPQFVFLDLVMPKMSGYETAKRMREQFDAGTMRIIAVSGYSAKLENLRQAGIDQHIRKPMDPMWLEGLLGHAHRASHLASHRGNYG
jgi:CheY-like chemotaxis protein